MLEDAADEMVSVGYRPGRKVATVVHRLLAGAECIDDLAVLRTGATARVLPFTPMAPSTVGTWLRHFTFGHVRQLDKLTIAYTDRGDAQVAETTLAGRRLIVRRYPHHR